MSRRLSNPATSGTAAIAWATTMLCCVIGLAITRPPFRADNGFTLLLGRNAEYLPFLPFLLIVPLIARFQHTIEPIRDLSARTKHWATTGPTFDVVAMLMIGVAALWGTARLAGQFDSIGPTYHDEFSYLFQAETYLRGEWSAPGFAERPALFDQMHVLSGERMASRYFPGTGFWFAPFLAIGHPWYANGTAHVLCSLLMYLCGRGIHGRLAGCVAGVLFALSPGLLLFSNLLLAHHPTLLGLLLFLWCYSAASGRGDGPNRVVTPRRQVGWLLAASVGLAFAMLCRPMTAAAFGFPFGCHFLATLFRVRQQVGLQVARFAAMAFPLAVGFGVVGLANHAITGDVFVTPYQQYNDLHTPRHVYGFSNGDRGDAAVSAASFEGKRRMTAYDEWAVNLTPTVAVENAGRRIEASTRLTLGVLPLAFVAVFWLASCRKRAPFEWMLTCSIVALHVAHVPYWFSGIMHWHYVLESSIGWLLLTGIVTQNVVGLAYQTKTDQAALIWLGSLLTAVVLNVVTVVPFFAAEVDLAASEVMFARDKYSQFFATVNDVSGGRPTVVLIQADDATPQIDYVVNRPGLDELVIYARLRPTDDLASVSQLFPERNVYLFDVAGERLSFLRPSIR